MLCRLWRYPLWVLFLCALTQYGMTHAQSGSDSSEEDVDYVTSSVDATVTSMSTAYETTTGPVATSTWVPTPPGPNPSASSSSSSSTSSSSSSSSSFVSVPVSSSSSTSSVTAPASSSSSSSSVTIPSSSSSSSSSVSSSTDAVTYITKCLARTTTTTTTQQVTQTLVPGTGSGQAPSSSGTTSNGSNGGSTGGNSGGGNSGSTGASSNGGTSSGSGGDSSPAGSNTGGNSGTSSNTGGNSGTSSNTGGNSGTTSNTGGNSGTTSNTGGNSGTTSNTGGNSGSTSVSKRGLAWAVDDNYASVLGAGKMSWYYHWENNVVTQMPSSIPYYPMLWGTSKLSMWQNVMAGFSTLPEYMLSFNEPDLASQSNMSPTDAAAAYQQYIQPYSAKGVKIGAPCLCWDFTWYQNFFNACQGCTFDFICMHWYGAYDAADSFQSQVQNFYNTFKGYSPNVWVTEWATTSSSGGSEAQVLAFQQQTTQWLEAQSYVQKIAWFGAWSQNPDGYASNYASMIDSNGQLTNAGQYWLYN